LKKKSLAFAIGAMGFGMERIFAPRARRARERCDARVLDGISAHAAASSSIPKALRFSGAKRRRALDRFHEKGDAKMLEYAKSLARVLPRRPGGTLGLLETAAAADVVFGAHAGFEGAVSLVEIWKGPLVNQTIRIQFRRIPRDEIPAGRDARIAWVLEEWQRVDAWVESRQLRESARRWPRAKSSSWK
jgi:hypothetical protein